MWLYGAQQACLKICRCSLSAILDGIGLNGSVKTETVLLGTQGVKALHINIGGYHAAATGKTLSLCQYCTVLTDQ